MSTEWLVDIGFTGERKRRGGGGGRREGVREGVIETERERIRSLLSASWMVLGQLC